MSWLLLLSPHFHSETFSFAFYYFPVSFSLVAFQNFLFLWVPKIPSHKTLLLAFWENRRIWGIFLLDFLPPALWIPPNCILFLLWIPGSGGSLSSLLTFTFILVTHPAPEFLALSTLCLLWFLFFPPSKTSCSSWFYPWPSSLFPFILRFHNPQFFEPLWAPGSPVQNSQVPHLYISIRQVTTQYTGTQQRHNLFWNPSTSFH